MDFDQQLLRNIREEAGFVRPRKIQEVVLPYLAEGNDIVCQSETGTGKTASYLIPIIDDLIKQKQANRLNAAGPYCIILAPTHEFVEQIFEEAQKFSKHTGITVARDYGGTDKEKMNELIAKGCNILCACLGRLLELMKEPKWSLLDRIKTSLSISKKQKPFNMSNVKYIVVDEADHFLEDKHQFLTFFSHKSLPKVNKIQNLFFSSTLQAPRLHELTKSYINLQKRVHITSVLESNQRIRYIVVSIPSESDKFLCLTKMVSDIGTANGGIIPKIMIFVNSINYADELTRYLTIAGFPAVVIHSELYPDERKEAYYSFKNGNPNSKLLVSVNACGRGVDIPDMDYVINYNLPTSKFTFIQRCGRTGRTKNGTAISFYVESDNRAQARWIREILQRAGQQIPEFLKENTLGIETSMNQLSLN
uniref:RNA helicase n=1 Tax=Panagrolaimus davidi TaxID=227884 RepID=A0A914PQY9_9BILA